MKLPTLDPKARERDVAEMRRKSGASPARGLGLDPGNPFRSLFCGLILALLAALGIFGVLHGWWGHFESVNF